MSTSKWIRLAVAAAVFMAVVFGRKHEPDSLHQRPAGAHDRRARRLGIHVDGERYRFRGRFGCQLER